MTSQPLWRYILMASSLSVMGLPPPKDASTARGGGVSSTHLVIDIQMMMDGKRVALSPDDYILAALNVHSDAPIFPVHLADHKLFQQVGLEAQLISTELFQALSHVHQPAVHFHKVSLIGTKNKSGRWNPYSPDAQ
jgi:hypothetical protein